MSQAIVECIPNFSEGRRPEVIWEISNAIQAVKGVRVLDQHSDYDHNRTVITFIGSPASVEEAGFAAIAKASELIDLNVHHGEHPRIGATDVMPFVPISGVSMSECIAIAQRVGQRVGDELQIPVYLYEEAARRPDRQNLENIRRGEYELLKDEISSKPEREPDYGPLRVGPAGATVIGARQPLIAYNVYLATDDVEIAKKIARAVRHSSGGLRYVKALGLLVEGRAQVSMNLTNYRATPIARVVEFIRREAERYGVSVHHSELVGLAPQAALVDAAVWYTQLDQFEPDQILEQRIYASGLTTPDEQPGAVDFLRALSSGSAAPGGGSAAAFAGALAAALVAMVAKLTIGKKKYAEVEMRMQEIATQADQAMSELTEAVKRDSAAFEAVMAAFKLPKDTEAEKLVRHAAIQKATLGAIESPMQVIRKVVDVLDLAVEVVQYGNVNAITDGGSGAQLAQASINAAGLNVRVNLSSLENQELAQQFLDELHAFEEKAAIQLDRIKTWLGDRGGLALV